MKSVLVLEDGTYFAGKAFGKPGETVGEIIFNTCMTGYQEVITTPSYSGQIVAMTYPLIGNYGFNKYDNESCKPHIKGFIVKELCETPSNWRCTDDPHKYFIDNNIVGIKGIDTRALTQHIRKFGSMSGIISTECGNIDTLLKKLKQKSAEKRNPVAEVTTKTIVNKPASGKRVVLLDLGVKNSIINSLEKRNCDIFILPAYSTFEEIMSYNPDGILLSNGPGDPMDLPEIKCTIQNLLGKKPIIGVGLGHQLLGLALGGSTYKLKFGHHGSNHPVKDFTTGRCHITSQGHSYALKKDFDDAVVITHININDDTVEGFKHKTLPVLGIQYHPEPTSDTQDSAYIFDDFVAIMNR